MSNELNVALINADTVVSLFQVHAAASRALLSVQNHSMTTNSLHSELVFNLSGTRNVTDSIRRFGISNQATQAKQPAMFARCGVGHRGGSTWGCLVCVFDDATALDTVGIDGVLKPVTSIENHAHLTPEHIQVLKKH
ncbi:hypothetical protein AaE_001145, partial [Aphanomyces astaci]